MVDHPGLDETRNCDGFRDQALQQCRLFNHFPRHRAIPALAGIVPALGAFPATCRDRLQEEIGFGKLAGPLAKPIQRASTSDEDDRYGADAMFAAMRGEGGLVVERRRAGPVQQAEQRQLGFEPVEELS